MRRSLVLALASVAMLFAQKRPFDANALLELKRIGDPQISPDGKTVAFTVQSVDLAANRKPQQVWTVPIEGGAPRQITHSGDNNTRPRWSPDGKRIAYISDRAGSAQIWLMDADGGNATQITSLATEADGEIFSPDGKYLVFSSSVYPECGADDACNKKNLDADSANPVKARVYTDLLYRHWTAWASRRRSHLLMAPAAGGAVRDLTPGDREVPPFSLGAPDDYDISPDGAELCYAVNLDPVPAVSTNTDLFALPLGGGAEPQQPVKITNGLGADATPRYSPDGKYLAWRAQARAGYESDRWRLMLLERSTGKVTSLTESIDRWVNSFVWAPDSSSLFFTTGSRPENRRSRSIAPLPPGALLRRSPI
jgi:Tol biopolymer transport system component